MDILNVLAISPPFELVSEPIEPSMVVVLRARPHLARIGSRHQAVQLNRRKQLVTLQERP